MLRCRSAAPCTTQRAYVEAMWTRTDGSDIPYRVFHNRIITIRRTIRFPCTAYRRSTQDPSRQFYDQKDYASTLGITAIQIQCEFGLPRRGTILRRISKIQVFKRVVYEVIQVELPLDTTQKGVPRQTRGSRVQTQVSKRVVWEAWGAIQATAQLDATQREVPRQTSEEDVPGLCHAVRSSGPLGTARREVQAV